VPFLTIDLIFFGANILRVTEGGWVPLLVASAMGLIIVAWLAGRKAALQRTSEQGVAMTDLAKALAARPPALVDGVAVFLTQDASVAPSALLHNLKHNKALHRLNILLTVATQQTPYVQPEARLSVTGIDDHFIAATLQYGYMDRVDVPSDLARSDLLKGTGGTSFFVGRNAIRRSANPAMPRWMTLIYSFLHRNAADPTAFFAIPPNRVVELGSQIEL
jgi:KUP system potassium uptake protein